jgi:CheY-like chemotaxis protein
MAKIMLVEDDNNLREIYGARLMAEGYEIVSAQDGEEALAIAVKEKPDLIISDVMMPRISGFDMLDILRNAPETKDTKVIMMTALSQAEDKSRADKLGADRYLVKSQVTLEDVTNVVHEVLGDAPSDDTASTETPTVTPAAPLADTGSPAPPSITDEEPTPVTTPQPTAPTVDAIANPDIKVTGEPNPGEVEAPPAAEAPVPAITSTTTTSATASDSSVPQPVIPAPDPSQFQPQTPPLATPTGDNSSQSTTLTTTDTATTTPPPADDTSTSLPPIVEPAKTTDVKPEDIKVELPTPAATPTSTIPESTPNQPQEPATTEPSVGPNLAEALAAEEEQLSSPKTEDTPSTPAPTVVTPTKIEVKTPQEETTTPPAESGNPATPNKKATGERVIQPINEPGDKPDLQALLAAEEKNEAISNPAANSVIAPEGPVQPPADTQKPSTDLNNIAI